MKIMAERIRLVMLIFWPLCLQLTWSTAERITGTVYAKDGWSGPVANITETDGSFQLDGLSVDFPFGKLDECKKIGTINIHFFVTEIQQSFPRITCSDLYQHAKIKNVLGRTYFPMWCNKLHSTCSCSTRVVMPYFKMRFRTYIGFDACEVGKPLDMKYSFKLTSLKFTCTVPHPAFPCISKGVVGKFLKDNGSFEGVTTFLTENDVYIIVHAAKEITCYQHIAEIVCRVKYPNCPGDKTNIVCREACEDGARACHTELSSIGGSPYLDGLCPLLPSLRNTRECWYKAPDCGEPPNVTHAYAKIVRYAYNAYSVLYSCRDSYTLVGASRINCSLSGKWNGTAPKCVKEKKLPLTTIIVSSVVAVIFNLSAALVVYFRKELLALGYVKFGCTIGRRFEKRRRYAAYIVSEGDDADGFVIESLLPALEGKHGLSVLANVRDGLLGTPLQEDCFISMKECSRAVFVINQPFLESSSLQQLFRQVEEYEEAIPGFRVIILLDKSCRRQKTRNKSLQAYLKAGVYLTPDRPCFIERLLYHLPTYKEEEPAAAEEEKETQKSKNDVFVDAESDENTPLLKEQC